MAAQNGNTTPTSPTGGAAPAPAANSMGQQPAPAGQQGQSDASKGGSSWGSKFSSSLAVAKTWTLQKLHKAEPTHESEEFTNMVKQFQANKVELHDMFDRAAKLLQLHTGLAEAESALGATVGKLGSHTKADAKAQETVQTFVPYTNVLQSHRKKYTDAIDTLLVKPLDALLQNEVKKTSALIAKLDSVRLHYDSATHRNKDLQESKTAKPQEKKDAEDQAKDATQQYETTKEQLKNLCEVVESRKNALLQEQLAEYVKAQQQFLTDSLQTVRDRDKKVPQQAGQNTMQPGAPGAAGKVMQGEF